MNQGRMHEESKFMSNKGVRLRRLSTSDADSQSDLNVATHSDDVVGMVFISGVCLNLIQILQTDRVRVMRALG